LYVQCPNTVGDLHMRWAFSETSQKIDSKPVGGMSGLAHTFAINQFPRYSPMNHLRRWNHRFRTVTEIQARGVSASWFRKLAEAEKNRNFEKIDRQWSFHASYLRQCPRLQFPVDSWRLMSTNSSVSIELFARL
jgi:hypothetical protein